MFFLVYSQRMRPAKEIKYHYLLGPLILLLSLLVTVGCCDRAGAGGFAFELPESVLDQSGTDYYTYAQLLQHAYAVPQSLYRAREY